MSGSKKAVASLLSGFLVVAPLFTAQAADQTASAPIAAHHRKIHRKKRAQLVLPPLPPGPLSQVPMGQIPATAPHVSYENGLLTIAAQNSTLADILKDVRNLTGASVELPPTGASERVVTQLGPGAPRDVLAMLLNGTAFNYVMLGSTSDPAAVAALVLTPKPTTGEVQTAAVYQPNPEPVPPTRMLAPQAFRQQMTVPLGQPQPGAAAAAPATDAEDATDEDKDDDDKDDESDPAQPAQPGQNVVAQPDGSVTPNQADQQATDPNQPNAGPKTPEQMLEMMRRGQPMVPPPPPPQQ